MPRATYIQKALNRKVGQAIHRYRMIEDGDRILVALSGGKDSLALLWTLAERRRRVPVGYTLQAVYVDPGFENGFAPALAAYCDRQGYRLHVVHTMDGPLSHSSENRENPCFLCARRRRQTLFELADEFGCNKLALGHNKDDLIETLMLNMCYAGEISTMNPRQVFFQGRFTIIRPLALTGAETIRRFCRQLAIPVFVNPCPSATRSERSAVRHMLEELYRSNSKIRGNIFRSMSRVRPEYLPMREDRQKDDREIPPDRPLKK